MYDYGRIFTKEEISLWFTWVPDLRATLHGVMICPCKSWPNPNNLRLVFYVNGADLLTVQDSPPWPSSYEERSRNLTFQEWKSERQRPNQIISGRILGLPTISENKAPMIMIDAERERPTTAILDGHTNDQVVNIVNHIRQHVCSIGYHEERSITCNGCCRVRTTIES